jgi:polysaccharide biosynthesis transport protein
MNDRSTALQRFDDQPLGQPMGYPRYPKAEQAQESDMTLKDFIQILRKRRWTLVLTFLTVIALVAGATLMMTPTYRASVMIKIDKENPNILENMKDSFGGVMGQLMGDDYYQTMHKVLKSRSLAKKVIYDMKLEQTPDFADAKRKADERIAAAGGAYKSSSVHQPSDLISMEVIDLFLDRVTVNPQQKSRLVKLSFDSHDPRLATDVTDYMANAFIEFNVERKFDLTSRSQAWLETQEKEMKAALEESEKALNKYVSDQGLVFIGGSDDRTVDPRTGVSTGNNGAYTIVSSKLAQLSTNYVQATAERIAKESAYRQLKNGDPNSNPAVLANPLLQVLKKDYATAESDYSQLSKQYRPDHPKMVRMKEQIVALKSKIDDEVKRTADSLKEDYDAAVKKEVSLAAALEQQKGEAMKTNEKLVRYQILKREVGTNRALYEMLLAKKKEAGIATSLTASNIQVLDIAETPIKQHRPNIPLNMAIGVFLGLFGGIGLVFLKEHMDDTVKTPEDIEKHVALPSLGMVPNFAAVGEKFGGYLITDNNVRGVLYESYRSIGAYIKFSSAGKPPRVMVVTSARPGEGKTTLSVNTAIALSRSGGRGVIVDADMRKPQIHKIFGADNSKGLSAYLTGHIELSHSGLIQHSKVENLDIVTAGIIPPNPSDLLSSERMQDLLRVLANSYSFVIIDSPPVLGLSDSVTISTMTDGVIMVLRSGATTKAESAQARKLLQGVNAKILGVVLNDISRADLKYGAYNYYSSYYYEYGGDGPSRSKRWKLSCRKHINA